MFSIEDYKANLVEILKKQISKDIEGTKKAMHKALDDSNYDELEELKRAEMELVSLLDSVAGVFDDNKNSVFIVEDKNSKDMQMQFDMSYIKEKPKPKLKMIPDKRVVRHHTELPYMYAPKSIYIDDDVLEFVSKTWKGVVEEVCNFCFLSDMDKFKNIGKANISNRIKDAKIDLRYGTDDEGDFKCYHGVWFYVRMSSQEAVKLIFEILDYMGFTSYEIVVERKRK